MSLPDSRYIFHVDVNSAFLSWSALEQLKADPSSVDLRTIPSAVGGDVETRHGIITAKSIPAKAYHIETGEPVVKALAKCPGLVLVRSDFAAYRRYSAALMQLLREYTSCVEQASIDEAYLDVSDALPDMTRPAALRLACEIKDRVKAELRFTVNVGVSVNKFLAKTASDFRKPDLVHTLFPEEVPDRLWPLPIGKLHGCGAATAGKLKGLGINTIGEAAHMELPLIQSLLGKKQGLYIHDRANGIDDRCVHAEKREAKSYSNESTTAEDISSRNYEAYGLPILRTLCEKVSGRLKRDHVYGLTISVIVKTGSFRRHTRQTTLDSSTNRADVIFSTAEALMQALLFSDDGLFRSGEVLRLIGVGVSGLDDGSSRQMDLTDWMDELRKMQQSSRATKEKERRQRLDAMVTSLQKKYGDKAIRKGRL